MRPAHIYASDMSSKFVSPGMHAAQDAIAAEVRALIARKGIAHRTIYERLDLPEQSAQAWFSRRIRGITPWSAEELVWLCDVIDADVSRVYRAGLSALRKTNLCLSVSIYRDAKSRSRRLAGRAGVNRTVNVNASVDGMTDVA